MFGAFWRFWSRFKAELEIAKERASEKGFQNPIAVNDPFDYFVKRGKDKGLEGDELYSEIIKEMGEPADLSKQPFGIGPS